MSRAALSTVVLICLAAPPAASAHQLGNGDIRVAVDPDSARLTVRVGAAAWRQCGVPVRRVRDISIPQEPGGAIAYEADVAADDGRVATALVNVTVAERGAALTVEIDAPDRNSDVSAFAFPGPFAIEGRPLFVVLPAYGEGLLLPTNDPSSSGLTCAAFGELEMPWFGVTDLTRGYICIIETPDDCILRLSELTAGGGRAVLPELVWLSSKRRFRYARRITYHFVEDGGYVALAKLFRAYARDRGWNRTLREKRRATPNVERLIGAPDIWGAGMAFCREAKTAGLDKALINGRFAPAEMRELVDMGYLVGEYDGVIGASPGACSALATAAAERRVPVILRRFPYNARFCAGATAEPLVECYDPAHGQTRSEDRASRAKLLDTMRRFGLVVGGEHGKFWAAPLLDYQEGMMRHGPASLPGPGDAALRRIPLWELVFHDCVVSTWDRTDGNGRLYDAAPETSDEKDALNVLYGTPPLMWASGPGYGWQRHRERFVQTYRNTCKWHERVGWEEMLSHEFLNEERTLQRTTFAGGYAAVVNFGERQETVAVRGVRHVLGRHDFVAEGPGFLQYRQRAPGGGCVMFIASGDYTHADPGERAHDFGVMQTSTPTAIRRIGRERLRVDLEGGGWALLRPKRIVSGWDGAGARMFRLDQDGERVRELLWPGGQREAAAPGESMRPPTELQLSTAAGAAFEIAWGNAARAPDLVVRAEDVEVRTRGSGELPVVTATVRNAGDLPARGAVVAVYAERAGGRRQLAQQESDLAPGEERRLAFDVTPDDLAGARFVTVIADPDERISELIETNNRASRRLSDAYDAR